MYLEFIATCVDITIEQWNEYMKGHREVSKKGKWANVLVNSGEFSTFDVKKDYTTSLFKKNSFDLIWSIAAIRHWRNLGDKGFNLWTTWLRPGGRMYFMWRTPITYSAPQIRREFASIINSSELNGCSYSIEKVKGPIRKHRLNDPYFTLFNGIKDK